MLTFLKPSILFAFILLHTLVFAFPILQRSDTLASLLRYKSYSELQISDGFGGNALEEAKSIFEDPFQNIPLVNVPYRDYERLLTLWEAVEYAKVISFPDAIEDARGGGNEALEQKLLVGGTKNHVLMMMAQVQILRIKIAKDSSQGVDTEDNEDTLYEFEERLMAAAADDRRNSGRVAQPVQLVYPL